MQAPTTEGTIRRLWPGETGQYRDHLLRLDSDSRRSRFSGAVSDDFILRHAGGATGRDALIEGFFVDGVLRGAAELRLLPGTFPEGPAEPAEKAAEAAFSVETEWQSHGVGSALLERTLLAARNRGVTHLHMACLRDNRRMQQLAKKFAAEIRFDFGSVVGAVTARRPTPLSLMREMLADSHGLAATMLDAQSRLLRTGSFITKSRTDAALTPYR